MKPISTNFDELCYPFIHEKGATCDFEIETDSLCSHIGLLLSMNLDDTTRDILTRLQPKVYHLNGSVRGKLALKEEDLDEVKQDYQNLKQALHGGTVGFVLPSGDTIACELHLCRTEAKKVVRTLVRIYYDDTKLCPNDILFKYTNVLANLFYALASYRNLIQNISEIPFISRSYQT